MKVSKKLLSILLSVAVFLTSMSIAVFAVDSKTYYYIDSINGDDANSGVNAEYKAETVIEKLIRLIRNIFETIIHEIMVIFD